MADYSSYYATNGKEVTVKFRLKPEKGNKFSKELFLFGLANSLSIPSAHCLAGIYYVESADPEILEIKDVKY